MTKAQTLPVQTNMMLTGYLRMLSSIIQMKLKYYGVNTAHYSQGCRVLAYRAYAQVT